MFELLLDTKRKELKKEYTLRFINILLLFLVGISGVWLALMIPTYVIGIADKKILSEDAEILEKSVVSQDVLKMTDLSTELQERIDLLVIPEVVYSELIGNITGKFGNNIFLNTMLIESGINSSQPRIAISGIAADRSSLRNFSQEISNDGLFEKITIPLSSFEKDTDLPFSFDLIVTENEN